MDPHLEILPNRKFLFDGAPVYFRKRARDPGGTYLFESEDGMPLPLTYDQVKEARRTNRLTDFLAPLYPTDTGPGGARAWVTLARATKEEAFLTERAIEYVLEYEANPKAYPRTDEGLAPLLAAVYERRKARADLQKVWEPPAYSASALVKLIRQYRNNGRNPDVLVPQTRNRGNYRCKLIGYQDTLVYNFIDEHFLKRNGDCAAEVHRKIAAHVRERNRTKKESDRWVAPSYDSVLNAIDKLCPFTIDFCRRGAAWARAKWWAIGSGIVTTGINEVWEVDDTRLDAICLHEDGKTVVGRPWLTVVIDRHSRMIMSFVISFSPPDTQTALEAIRMAIHNKAELLAANPTVRGTWPAEGRPSTVHVDNGKHYNSDAFKRALASLGIAHRTMPVLKPWYKGTVERAIGTLMRNVFHTVAGTTYANIFERDRDAPPEDVATATIAELRLKLLKWIVMDYQHRDHKGIDMTPNALWHRSRREQPEPLPLAARDIDLKLSLTVTRTLRRDGLEIHGLKFSSPALLRLCMAPKAVRPRELVVRLFRDNLTVVEFLDTVTDPSREQWLPAFLNDEFVERVKGRTLDEYLLARAMRRENPEDFGDNDPDFTATYDRMDANREAAANADTLGPRTQAAGERERLLKEADRRTDPARRKDAPPAEGEDLQSLIDGEIGGVPVQVPSEPSTGVVEPHGTTNAPPRLGPTSGEQVTPPKTIAEHAVRHGLGGRIRRRGRTEEGQ